MKKPFKGLSVLVTAGPTREFFDPVRFLSNPSSGKMGYAIAQAVTRLGGRVVLISGPSSLSPIRCSKFIPVVSAGQMYRAVMKEAAKADVVIMTAAVSDYRPARISRQKIKKSGGGLTIRLVPTPDILKELGKKKRPGQCLVGFAAETNRLEENALKKLRRKNLDLIVANRVGRNRGFENERNKFLIFSKNRTKKIGKWSLPLMKKEAAAEKFLQILSSILLSNASPAE